MYEFIYNKLKLKSINDHYLNRYIKFIKNFDSSGNVRHHILPKADDMFPEYLSFKDNEWNKSMLSERAHFIAHWLLWKAVGGSQTLAFYQMKNKNGERLNSTTYSNLLKEFKESLKDPERRKKISESMKNAHKEKRVGMHGKTQTAYQRMRVSEVMSGVPKTEQSKINKQKTMKEKIENGWVYPSKEKTYDEFYGEERANEIKKKISENHHDVSGSNNPRYGVTIKGTKTAKKIAEKAKNREKKECPHCNKIVDLSNYARWHGDNCKNKL